eukprot:6209124-Pleurochrysis_carterae.AAC.1
MGRSCAFPVHNLDRSDADYIHFAAVLSPSAMSIVVYALLAWSEVALYEAQPVLVACGFW